MDYKEETIAAIATPIGVGGIGIIRISGCNAENIAQKIFRSKSPVKSFDSFRLYLGHIIDPKSNLPVDEVLLSVMRAPFSYTREDVVEINSHSGYALLSYMLQIILQTGARLAKPGEFTLRSFLNGRIDLTQAEAIIDLINAKGDMSMRLAAGQLIGGLKTKINEIRQVLLEILADIECLMDFPDEKPSEATKPHTADRLNEKIIKPIKNLIAAYTQRKIWHEGTAVVIAGKVNVGKSSILNRFLQEDRAIVTPIPGTTRDSLEYTVTIEGLPLKLVDTAGIRKVRGEVERKGVHLTNTHLGLADLTLLVIDRSRLLNKHDVTLLRKIDKGATIVIINKIDLPAKLSDKKIDAVFQRLPRVPVSALTGEGFETLNKAIFNKVVNRNTDMYPTSIVPNIRHKTTLTNASVFLEKASKNLIGGFPLEIVAADLLWAKDALDEITGNKSTEEILDNIFSKFCIGK
jgi:tRNA modification GTPase